jgi:hypothetical protein
MQFGWLDGFSFLHFGAHYEKTPNRRRPLYEQLI